MEFLSQSVGEEADLPLGNPILHTLRAPACSVQPWLRALRIVIVLLPLLAITAKRDGALTGLGIVLSSLTHLSQVLIYRCETEARLMEQLAWGPHSKAEAQLGVQPTSLSQEDLNCQPASLAPAPGGGATQGLEEARFCPQSSCASKRCPGRPPCSLPAIL